MSLAWKETLRQRLADRGMSQAELEHAIGAARGAVAKILAEDQTSSVWVAAICKHMDMDPPGPITADEEKLLDCFRRSSDEGRRALLQHALAASGIPHRRSS